MFVYIDWYTKFLLKTVFVNVNNINKNIFFTYHIFVKNIDSSDMNEKKIVLSMLVVHVF